MNMVSQNKIEFRNILELIESMKTEQQHKLSVFWVWECGIVLAAIGYLLIIWSVPKYWQWELISWTLGPWLFEQLKTTNKSLKILNFTFYKMQAIKDFIT